MSKAWHPTEKLIVGPIKKLQAIERNSHKRMQLHVAATKFGWNHCSEGPAQELQRTWARAPAQL